MYLVISGILIFTFGHMFKRLVPAGRDFVDQKLGEKLGKKLMRLILFIGFFLVAIGYYQKEYDIYIKKGYKKKEALNLLEAKYGLKASTIESYIKKIIK